MRVIDPGHKYALPHLDGDGEEILTFVKRCGDGYPGNVGHHEGTTTQETLRALIHRNKYTDNQIACQENIDAIDGMRKAIYALEVRAARRHGRPSPAYSSDFEARPTCRICGHVECIAHGLVAGTEDKAG